MDADPNLETRISLLLRLKQSPTDERAWREFVDRYGPRIRTWSARWGVQDADADDVAQDVLKILASRLQRFEYDASRSFRAWLKTVTHNALRDSLAAQKRGTVGGGDTKTLQLLESVPAREDLMEQLREAFDLELLDLAVERVRARIQPATWDAFQLTAVEGLSGVEAAARLAMPVASVFKAKSNVQKLLRQVLQELESDE